MIDYFSLALSHGLLALAFWRLMLRVDLDADGAEGGDPPRIRARDGKAPPRA